MKNILVLLFFIGISYHGNWGYWAFNSGYFTQGYVPAPLEEQEVPEIFTSEDEQRFMERHGVEFGDKNKIKEN